jgi:hypothetical protein
VIQLADGREITVHHREFLAIGPAGRTVVVYQPDESFDVVDLLRVSRLYVLSSPNMAGVPLGS